MLMFYLFLLAAALPVRCRYIISHGQQTTESALVTDFADEDVDLEEVLNDYYDGVLKDLEEALSSYHGEVYEEELKGEEELKIADYDYLSDMAAAEDEDGRDYKTNFGSGIPFDDGNFTGQPFNSTSEDPVLQKVSRESSKEGIPIMRSKELRLNAIKSQILSLRGGEADSNGTVVPPAKQFETLQKMYEQNMRRMPDWEHTNTYTEKVQSFYPSCDIPRNTDEDLWSDSNSMNLLFELNYPTTLNGTTVSIISARLRLYKLSQGNYSMPPQDQAAPGFRTKPEKSSLAIHNFGILPPAGAPLDDDRQIRVSVYWYTRSLKKNRMKRKLLDSQMLSVYGEEWTEFNIRTAVRTWKDSGKNFGLVITVEDEDGTLLNADQYIHAMNCSKFSASVRPIPSILMDAAKNYLMDHPINGSSSLKIEMEPKESNGTSEEAEKSEQFPYQSLPYPIIDLCSVEIPNSEVRNVVFDSQILSFSRKRPHGNQNSNFTFILIKNEELKNSTSTTKSVRKPELKKVDPEVGETHTEPAPRPNFFHNVALGSPSAGQNRNFLVPMMTKSELNMVDPLEAKMRMQSEMSALPIPQAMKNPRHRHNRRQQRLLNRSKDDSVHSARV